MDQTCIIRHDRKPPPWYHTSQEQAIGAPAPKTAIEGARAKTPLKPGDWGYPPRKPFGWVGSKKPDRSWVVEEFRGKVRSEVIKFIHPEG